MKHVYFAAPLFTNAERQYNLAIATAIEQRFQVFLPQRDVGLLNELLATGLEYKACIDYVYRHDMEGVQNSWAVICVVDGPSVDDGVSFELGIAVGLGLPTLGLRTDIRHSSRSRLNPMVECSLNKIVSTPEMVIQWLERLDRARSDSTSLGESTLVTI